MWEHMSRGSESPRTELLYNIDPLDPPELSVAAIRDTRYKLVLDGTGYNSERYETAGGRRPYEDLDKLLVQSKTSRVLRKLYGTKRLRFPRGWRRRATLTCGKGTRENFSANDTVFLFDIVKDPCELNNLASESPQIVSALMKRLDAYRAVTVPIENLPFDPASAPEYHNGTWAPWLD
ncbi:arylsulfatase J-like [Rhipicephalus sanguineus]|uniref:arylsulfatase J-like n=1 Tax=Rhipicephalus sanguineus TaxID=34632 RepID=UPI0020C41C23|nr:arylsulfatase J-like [Rhipicephalus sanguineus]